jgi:hypothetical protein
MIRAAGGTLQPQNVRQKGIYSKPIRNHKQAYYTQATRFFLGFFDGFVKSNDFFNFNDLEGVDNQSSD